MKRSDKYRVVEELKEVFQSSDMVIISHNKGLTVSDVNQLRQDIKNAASTYTVTKNTLTRIAIKGTKFEGLERLLSGPTSIAYSNNPVMLAKTMVNYSKKNEKLELLGGVMDQVFLDVNTVKSIASLPSLDELRGKIVGLLNAPATKIVGVLQAPGAQIARILNAYSSK